MAKKTRNRLSDLEGLIAPGENPKGFTAQTANGTAHTFGTGWNRILDYGYSEPEISEKAVWPLGRSTRTGE
jgi:hypothetical protein